MKTIGLVLKSRTFWTIVVMFLMGGVESIRNLIPAGDMVYVEGLLGLLATYFHVNPSQNYNG